jgi:ketosteroid isomerase-like protein
MDICTLPRDAGALVLNWWSGAMDRQGMLRTIEEAYAARVRGDVDGVLRAFAPDADFRINATPSHPQLGQAARDADALRNALKQLIDAFAFTDAKIVDSVIEGSKAAVRTSVTVRARSTGKSAKTELLDLLEFRDGKIVSFAQFCDTALANHLAVD